MRFAYFLIFSIFVMPASIPGIVRRIPEPNFFQILLPNVKAIVPLSSLGTALPFTGTPFGTGNTAGHSEFVLFHKNFSDSVFELNQYKYFFNKRH